MLLTSPGSDGCRLAKGWLKAHQIPFTERNIFAEPLSVEEVKTVMCMTEYGTDEVISKRSKTIQRLNLDVDALPLQYLFKLMINIPGYCEDRSFLMRNGFKWGITKRTCANSYQDKFVPIIYRKRKKPSTCKILQD